jgi:hypothetical protein
MVLNTTLERVVTSASRLEIKIAFGAQPKHQGPEIELSDDLVWRPALSKGARPVSDSAPGVGYVKQFRYLGKGNRPGQYRARNVEFRGRRQNEPHAIAPTRAALDHWSLVLSGLSATARAVRPAACHPGLGSTSGISCEGTQIRQQIEQREADGGHAASPTEIPPSTQLHLLRIARV